MGRSSAGGGRSSGGGRSFSGGGSSRGFSGGFSSPSRSSSSSSSHRSSSSSSSFSNTPKRSSSPSPSHKNTHTNVNVFTNTYTTDRSYTPSGRRHGYNTYDDDMYTSARRTSSAGTRVGMFIILIAFLGCILVSSILVHNKVTTTISTINREKLESQLCTESTYLIDETGWISSKSTLEVGMREFYQETGVQPVLLLTTEINGNTNPTVGEIEAYMNQVYKENIKDEGHLLFMFFDRGDGSYGTFGLTGINAKTVIDDEAVAIIRDYVDRYATSDMSDEQMFSTVFSKSAKSIMRKSTTSADVLVIVIIVSSILLMCVIGGAIFLKAKAYKVRELEEANELLNKDI